jgi:hypothetical protein
MSVLSLFKELSFSFEDHPLNQEHVIVSDEMKEKNCYFGIIKVEAVSCLETTKPQEFLFVIDCSGSMSDICSDGRTKMQHIKHTLKNMICYFCDKSFISITVCVFDDEFEIIVNSTDVNQDNILMLYACVDKIQPRGQTNIEKALKSSNKILRSLLPNMSKHMIFMTDGSVTCGSSNLKELKKHVPDTSQNVFIGFGIEHDAVLLNSISENMNSSYYFIDKLEKSGLVYGEIIHEILYSLMNSVKINIRNGFVYDFKTNSWLKELNVGSLVGETNKTYHIISSEPDKCQVTIAGSKDDETQIFHVSKLMSENINYIKYVFRQRVLQTLFKINKINKINQDSGVPNCDFRQDLNIQKNNKLEKELLKVNTKKLLDELIAYMKNNDLTNDDFYKNLCDDLTISLETMTTRYGVMYSSARQVSQGSQRAHTVNHCPMLTKNSLLCESMLNVTPVSKEIMREMTQSLQNSHAMVDKIITGKVSCNL